MIQLTSRERGIFIFFLIVCSIYAAYAFIYRPFLVEGQRIEEDLRFARKKLSDQMRVIQKERNVPHAYREAIASKRQQSAPEEVMSSILSEIETVSREMTIRITEMKPQRVLKADDVNKFPVSLTIDGKFQDLMAFIHLLQAPEHDLQVTQFYLEKEISDPAKLLAKIVVVRTLILPQPEAMNERINTKGAKINYDEPS